MVVKVTAKHIARGKKKNDVSCPVALALRDAGFPRGELRDTYVDRFPRSIERFMDKFDRGQSVKPFNFIWE